MPNVRGIPQSKSDLKAVRIFRGLSIYKVRGSQYWYVRVWDSDARKYRVKGTGETSRIEAREAAIDYARTVLEADPQVPVEFTFKHFAVKCLAKGSRLAADGDRHIGTIKAIGWALQNNDWGLLRWFGRKDVRKITTRDFTAYMEDLSQRRPQLSSSSRNSIMSAFRNVLKVAMEQGAIDAVPATPRTKQVDNPRPFFRFFPLVPEKDDALRRLLTEAKAMADQGLVIRGVPVTDELHDRIAFLVQSFVRPLGSELYAIRHNDVTVSEEPLGLTLVIRDGKTGHRVAVTMPEAVETYRRARQRYLWAKGEDYVFLPQYPNRATAGQIIQRQFRTLMARTGLQRDVHTGKPHTIYSLRHTAICKRLVDSGGKVNIFTLAKNAGTSVDQIERFYARHLPLSKELWTNLQSFSD
jgi:site-specific recombinase XerC